MRAAALRAGREEDTMFGVFHYLRGHVYPRGRLPQPAGSGRLRASDTILGMMIVMLAVVGVGYAVEIALF